MIINTRNLCTIIVNNNMSCTQAEILDYASGVYQLNTMREEKENSKKTKYKINKKERENRITGNTFFTSEKLSSESILIPMSIDIFETWRRISVLVSPTVTFFIPECRTS